MMLADPIPMVERTYRVLGHDNRAMAGLPMGGIQTFTTARGRLDMFAYIGGFRGSSGGPAGAFDRKTSSEGVFAVAAVFNKKVECCSGNRSWNCRILLRIMQIKL